MGHENSETVKIGTRWFNRSNAGAPKRILGNKQGYATMKQAVAAAKQRSKNFRLPKRNPRR